jgi:hypothetical protein
VTAATKGSMGPALGRRAMIGGLAALVLIDCGQHDLLRAEVQAAKDRTVADRGSLTNPTQLQRDGQSVTAAWEIETSLGWDAYAEGVVGRFGDYRVSERRDGALALTKQLPGDVLTVVLTRRQPSAGRTIVAVVFTAAPS